MSDLYDMCRCGHTRAMHNGRDKDENCVYQCGCKGFKVREA